MLMDMSGKCNELLKSLSAQTYKLFTRNISKNAQYIFTPIAGQMHTKSKWCCGQKLQLYMTYIQLQAPLSA